jgi:hypothetical protein
MKSLNDSLREEFEEILNKDNYKEVIEEKKLELVVLKKAFDTLLKYKTDSDAIEKSRTEFETYLINHIKTNKNDNK